MKFADMTMTNHVIQIWYIFNKHYGIEIALELNFTRNKIYCHHIYLSLYLTSREKGQIAIVMFMELCLEDNPFLHSFFHHLVWCFYQLSSHAHTYTPRLAWHSWLLWAPSSMTSQRSWMSECCCFSPAAITILNSKHEGEMKYGRILIRRRFEKRGGDQTNGRGTRVWSVKETRVRWDGHGSKMEEN